MPNRSRSADQRDMHIYVPNAVAEEIDALVGPRQRSAFLVEAAVEKLARLRRQARRRATDGSGTAYRGQPDEATGEDAPESPADPDRQRFDTLWGR